jgi:hypothetical protein
MPGLVNAITVLHGGNQQYQAIFMYDLVDAGVTLLKDKDETGADTAANFIVSPASDLPAEAKFTTAERNQFDAGTHAWETISVTQNPGMDDAAFLAHARSLYASRKAGLSAWYADEYKHRGKKFEETA